LAIEPDAAGVLHLIEQDARAGCEIIESANSSCWRHLAEVKRELTPSII
jgi:hypothetical protein